MQYDLFPDEYEKKIGEANSDFITAEYGKHLEKQNTYRDRINSNIGSVACFILGIVGGFVVCIVTCTNFGEIGLTVGSLIMIIPFILGPIIDRIIAARGERFIKEEEDTFQEWMENFRKIEAQKVKNYRESFENEAQKLSLEFYKNPITEEIINKMKGDVGRKISHADRRSYVEKISVYIYCSVYKNKVEWGYEQDVRNYNFITNRCAVLKKPIEQAALARALARKLENFIKQEYCVDISGTRSVTEGKVTEMLIYESGVCEYSRIWIMYEAPNGYYKKARLW
ncbi:MAG TPA: hypothetical protein DCE60_03835 [Coprococcus sp.]|nr:hypothetical protein [Coprococcus sp.]